ncbi:MAG: potassium transporter TrkH [Alphaproteobacteria bacterium]|nr:potassium transporter TrkH [Alphaproteobacteria bacterium]
MVRPATRAAKLSPILYVIGLILLALAAAMTLTALVGLSIDPRGVDAFIWSAFATAFIGGGMAVANRSPRLDFEPRQAFALTVLSWVAAAAFGSLPFLLIDPWTNEIPPLSLSHAFFESMSGLTTTGSTILVRLDRAPHTLLLWRALLQGMGGIGIIVIAIAVLPFLRVGGMQLFKTESSDRSEKVMPRPGQIAAATAQVYFLLTVLCAIAYLLAGMSPFDAVAHALPTISTGGFSTYDASFAQFEERPLIHWLGTLFMLLGAMPFVLFVRVANGRVMELVNDTQVRGFVFVVAVATIAVAAWLVFRFELPITTALRLAAFNLVSVLTTTGFAAGDYTTWGGFPVGVVLLLTFLGGCSGSTAGGIKIFRLQIIFVAALEQVNRLVHRHAVRPRQFNDRRLSDEVIASVLVFFAIYLTTVIAFTLVLSACDLDVLTAFTGAATAVGNVGPGLGTIIGPSGNFSTLPEPAIWALSLAMLMGRLELLTVFVLLIPSFWRG